MGPTDTLGSSEYLSTISVRCKILKPGILYDGKKKFFKNFLILIDLAEEKLCNFFLSQLQETVFLFPLGLTRPSFFILATAAVYPDVTRSDAESAVR